MKTLQHTIKDETFTISKQIIASCCRIVIALTLLPPPTDTVIVALTINLINPEGAEVNSVIKEMET